MTDIIVSNAVMSEGDRWVAKWSRTRSEYYYYRAAGEEDPIWELPDGITPSKYEGGPLEDIPDSDSEEREKEYSHFDNNLNRAGSDFGRDVHQNITETSKQPDVFTPTYTTVCSNSKTESHPSPDSSPPLVQSGKQKSKTDNKKKNSKPKKKVRKNSTDMFTIESGSEEDQQAEIEKGQQKSTSNSLEQSSAESEPVRRSSTGGLLLKKKHSSKSDKKTKQKKDKNKNSKVIQQTDLHREISSTAPDSNTNGSNEIQEFHHNDSEEEICKPTSSGEASLHSNSDHQKQITTDDEIQKFHISDHESEDISEENPNHRNGNNLQEFHNSNDEHEETALEEEEHHVQEFHNSDSELEHCNLIEVSETLNKDEDLRTVDEIQEFNNSDGESNSNLIEVSEVPKKESKLDTTDEVLGFHNSDSESESSSLTKAREVLNEEEDLHAVDEIQEFYSSGGDGDDDGGIQQTDVFIGGGDEIQDFHSSESKKQNSVPSTPKDSNVVDRMETTGGQIQEFHYSDSERQSSSATTIEAAPHGDDDDDDDDVQISEVIQKLRHKEDNADPSHSQTDIQEFHISDSDHGDDTPTHHYEELETNLTTTENQTPLVEEPHHVISLQVEEELTDCDDLQEFHYSESDEGPRATLSTEVQVSCYNVAALSQVSDSENSNNPHESISDYIEMSDAVISDSDQVHGSTSLHTRVAQHDYNNSTPLVHNHVTSISENVGVDDEIQEVSYSEEDKDDDQYRDQGYTQNGGANNSSLTFNKESESNIEGGYIDVESQPEVTPGPEPQYDDIFPDYEIEEDFPTDEHDQPEDDFLREVPSAHINLIFRSTEVITRMDSRIPEVQHSDDCMFSCFVFNNLMSCFQTKKKITKTACDSSQTLAPLTDSKSDVCRSGNCDHLNHDEHGVTPPVPPRGKKPQGRSLRKRIVPLSELNQKWTKDPLLKRRLQVVLDKKLQEKEEENRRKERDAAASRKMIRIRKEIASRKREMTTLMHEEQDILLQKIKRMSRSSAVDFSFLPSVGPPSTSPNVNSVKKKATRPTGYGILEVLAAGTKREQEVLGNVARRVPFLPTLYKKKKTDTQCPAWH